jgi:hypothetical protein
LRGVVLREGLDPEQTRFVREEFEEAIAKLSRMA